MTRLGIAQKLGLVCATFGIPIVVMFVLMVRAKVEQVNFAEQELAGTAFLRPLIDVLEHATAHRAAAHESAERALRSRAQATAALERALHELEVQQHAVGARLQFDAQGLGLRGRSAFTTEQLGVEVQAVKTGQGAAYERLIRHVRTMITHAGDSSNLILDPDLDSYYMMDALLLALPALEARLMKVLAELEALRADDASDARQQLSLDAAFIDEAEWGHARAALAAAQTEDANFFSTSPTLRPALEQLTRRTDAQAQKLVGLLRASAGEARQTAGALSALEAQVGTLAAEVYQLHRVGFGELDTLLALRIQELRRRLWFGCALALLSIAAAAVSATFLARGIVRRIARIATATKAFAQGEVSARVGHAGSDELGALASSFDGMAARIGALRAELAARADELSALNQSLERTVAQRTSELSRRNAEFSLILDVAHDGMLTIDLTGVMSSERSAAVQRLLGPAQGCERLQDYARLHDPGFADALALGLTQVEADELPLELTLAQLPARMSRLVDHRHEDADSTGVLSKLHSLRVLYQPILEGGRVKRLLVILTDITAELSAEQARATQEEALRIFHACQRDHAGFLSFLLEGRELVELVGAQAERGGVELARALHTLKGNCGLFGVLSVASLCHELESRMADSGGELSAREVAQLTTAWERTLTLASQFVGEHAARSLEVSEAEYAALVEDIAKGKARTELLSEIASWKLEPVERRFKRFAEQAQGVARRLAKELTVEVEANGLRVSEQSWAPVWSALVHVIRNAVDHGIEDAAERVAKGKPAHGTLLLRAYLRGAQFVLEVADDGRGVAWSALAEKAKLAGLPHQTQAELVDALFADGVSTRDQVTQLSGRGVGMAAVRQACLELGGRIELESVPDQGTVVRCIFAKRQMNDERVAMPQIVHASLPDRRTF